jgi:hypothetical protein
MNKFKTKIVALLMIMALALTGCMTETDTFTIKSDGTATMVGQVYLEKEATDENLAKLEDDSEFSYFATAFKESVKVVTLEDGKEYYEYSTSENISKSKLNTAFADSDANSYVTKDTVYTTIQSQLDDSLLQQFALLQTKGIDVDVSSIKMVFEVVMPSKVLKTTGKIDAANPNKVTYTCDMTDNVTVFVTTKQGVTESSVKKLVKAGNTIAKPKITQIKADKVKKNAKKASVTIKFNKVKGAKKYTIKYSTNKNLISAKTKTVKTAKKVVIKNLNKNKKYYFRIYASKNNCAGISIVSQPAKKTIKTKK